MIQTASLKKTALLISAVASFLTPFMGSSVNIALPQISHEFTLNAILLSWVATSYFFAAAVFLVPFGKLADIYGRKRIFTIGVVIYVLASFLSAVSTSAPMLIVFRVIHGFGSAMIFGTAIAIITSIFPPQERGRAIGINVAGVYLGGTMGPFIGGFLTQHLGWRSLFYLNGILGAGILFLILWKLKGEWAEAAGEKFDLIGSIIYSIMLVAIMYGLTSLPGIHGFCFIAVGLIGFIIFIIWEMRILHPVLNLKLFRHNMVFTFSNIAALINYSATMAIAFLLSLYLQYIHGLTPSRAGLVMAFQPAIMTLFSPMAGRLSDRIEPRVIASLGMGLIAAGLFILSLINETTSLAIIILSLIILGLGFALFSSPNTNAVMGSVDKKFYGLASATLGTMRLLGQMLSMATVMTLFSLLIGKTQLTPQYYPLFLKSMKIAFMIFTFLCFSGIFTSLARGKVRTHA